MTMSGKSLESGNGPIRKNGLDSVVTVFKVTTIIVYVALFISLFIAPLDASWLFILICASIAITALTIPLHAINAANAKEMYFFKAFLLSYMAINICAFFVMAFFIMPSFLVWGIYTGALIIVAFFILAFNQKARS